jgi:hypothetical protein
MLSFVPLPVKKQFDIGLQIQPEAKPFNLFLDLEGILYRRKPDV